MSLRLLRQILGLVTVGVVVVSCAPKDEKNTIVKERQAPEKLTESIQISEQNASTLVLRKDALNKAFLLTPSVVISKRMPEFSDFRPQVVSFERSATKIGLFKLSSTNLYDTIPTDKLLQTFNIIKESADSITIDISEGFKNITYESHLNIVDSDTLKSESEASEGLEKTLQIKDALVRKSEILNNIMYIEQAVRISGLSQSATEAAKTANNDPIKNELTARMIVEIKPYVLNTNFQSQLFDKEQRVGYFINLAYLAKQDYLLPQITKWDLSPERGVITVALEDNIPKEIVETVAEGITYWNRVVGREVLKIRTGFKATDRVFDRMIVVRWVQWDTAGFAYASMQTDPLSGEILRAQIFMTSSWLKYAKADTKFPINQVSGLCFFDQSQMQLTNNMANLSESHKLKYAQDIIRMVVAHEMGHVMGLRHNFSGSMNHEGSDDELLKAKKDFLIDENHPGFALSSTVMDYERGTETALIGAYIKNATLSYDRSAIGWGYRQEKIELPVNSYCSDEHIGLARSQSSAVYGCERFDSLKNSARGELETFKESLKNVAGKTFARVINDRSDNNPYAQATTLENQASVNFGFGFNVIDRMIYAPAPGKFTLLSIESVVQQIKSNISNSTNSVVTYDTTIESRLQNDLKELGGLSGLASQALDLQNNNPQELHILENQVKDFFKVLDVTQTGLTSAELEKVVTTMTATAKLADQDLLPQLMSKLLPVNGNSPVMRYRENISLGDTHVLMTLFKQAILSKKAEPRKITVNGQELEVQLLGYANYYRNNLVKAFVLGNWPVNKQSEVSAALKNQLSELKTEIVANTITVLKAAGVPVPETLNYSELSKALQSISTSQMSGIYANELISYDLAVLLTLENAKPE